MPFDVNSLPRKVKQLAGEAWSAEESWLDISANCTSVRKNTVPVILPQSSALNDIVQVRDWCEDMFGDSWAYEYSTFYFANEKAAMLFTLRWC